MSKNTENTFVSPKPALPTKNKDQPLGGVKNMVELKHFIITKRWEQESELKHLKIFCVAGGK